MKLVLKVLAYLFTILFTFGAVVQYNDPDATLWIVIYLLAATLSVLYALDKLQFIFPLLMGISCIVGFIYLYPNDFQGFNLSDGNIKTVELGREAFGLLIIAIVMLLFSFQLYRKSKV